MHTINDISNSEALKFHVHVYPHTLICIVVCGMKKIDIIAWAFIKISKMCRAYNFRKLFHLFEVTIHVFDLQFTLI